MTVPRGIASCCGNLTLREPAEVGELYSLSLVPRQAVERCPQFLGRELLVHILPDFAQSPQFEVIVEVHGSLAVPGTSPVGIDGAMVDDRQEPAPDAALTAILKRCRPGPYLHEGILHGLLGCAGIAQDPVGEPERNPIVPIVERHEGGVVTGGDRLQELQVGKCGVFGRQAVPPVVLTSQRG